MSKSKLNPRIVCNDGFSVSIQVGCDKYSTPQLDVGPFSEMELGFPSKRDPLLDRYQEIPGIDARKSVYPYVPVDVIKQLIDKHGGIKEGKLPN